MYGCGRFCGIEEYKSALSGLMRDLRIFNSISPDSAQSNERLCFSDGRCSAGYGAVRADAGLK